MCCRYFSQIMAFTMESSTVIKKFLGNGTILDQMNMQVALMVGCGSGQWMTVRAEHMPHRNTPVTPNKAGAQEDELSPCVPECHQSPHGEDCIWGPPLGGLLEAANICDWRLQHWDRWSCNRKSEPATDTSRSSQIACMPHQRRWLKWVRRLLEMSSGWTEL